MSLSTARPAMGRRRPRLSFYAVAENVPKKPGPSRHKMPMKPMTTFDPGLPDLSKRMERHNPNTCCKVPVFLGVTKVLRLEIGPLCFWMKFWESMKPRAMKIGSPLITLSGIFIKTIKVQKVCNTTKTHRCQFHVNQTLYIECVWLR